MRRFQTISEFSHSLDPYRAMPRLDLSDDEAAAQGLFATASDRS